MIGRRSLAALVSDLDERVQSSVAMAERARVTGPSADRDAAHLLERLGGEAARRLRRPATRT